MLGVHAREAGLARVLKWMIASSGSVITDVIWLNEHSTTYIFTLGVHGHLFIAGGRCVRSSALFLTG